MDRIMTKDFFAKFGVAGRAAAAAFALVCAALFPLRAEALAQADVAPAVFEALGRGTPEKFLTAVDGDMTRRDALRFAFEAMGWGFALAAVDQIGILPEWPEVEGVSYISATMSPQPPAAMTAALDEPLTPEDMEGFESWLRECRKSVSWKTSFSWNGTTLFMVKRGGREPVRLRERRYGERQKRAALRRGTRRGHGADALPDSDGGDDRLEARGAGDDRRRKLRRRRRHQRRIFLGREADRCAAPPGAHGQREILAEPLRLRLERKRRLHLHRRQDSQQHRLRA